MAFIKATLTPKELLKGAFNVITNSPKLYSAMRSDRLSSAQTEKLMLAVTSVYNCRYCNWMHSELAERFGIPHKEIEALLHGEFLNVSKADAAALNFAVSYASTKLLSSNSFQIQQAIEELIASYDTATVDDIRVLVEFVSFTNLLGNTFDAALAFAYERHISNGGMLTPLLVFPVMLPIYLTIALLTKKGRNPFSSLDV